MADVDADLLDALGWLRGIMQGDKEISVSVMRIVYTNGFDDLGRFAFGKQEAFLMLVDGIRDLVDQELPQQ